MALEANSTALTQRRQTLILVTLRQQFQGLQGLVPQIGNFQRSRSLTIHPLDPLLNSVPWERRQELTTMVVPQVTTAMELLGDHPVLPLNI